MVYFVHMVVSNRFSQINQFSTDIKKKLINQKIKIGECFSLFKSTITFKGKANLIWKINYMEYLWQTFIFLPVHFSVILFLNFKYVATPLPKHSFNIVEIRVIHAF